MNILYLPSHLPTHLPDIFGSGWVHGAPREVASEGLMQETRVDVDDFTTSWFPVHPPRFVPQGLGVRGGSNILVC